MLDKHDLEQIEDIFDRKFDEKFDQKFDEKFDQKMTIEHKIIDQKFDKFHNDIVTEFKNLNIMLNKEFHKINKKFEIQDKKFELYLKEIKAISEKSNKHENEINKINSKLFDHDIRLDSLENSVANNAV